MNAQTFLDNFGYIANAPDGIKRLRELMLALAMQGNLVPQNPNDPPASELLIEIEIEKKQLVKEKKIRPNNSLSQVKAEEVPYQIPNGWEWVRLGSIGNIFNGNSINAREKEIKYTGTIGLPYIATKDVEYGFEALNYNNGIFIPVSDYNFKIAHQGAVLLCSEGGSAGKKCGITDRDICFGNKLFANELFGGIPSKLILYQYLTPFFKVLFRGAMTGIIGGVSVAKFVELLIPLPPLAEQKRIVAKVDELMELCDKLEAQQRERERRFPVLSSTCHARLAESPTLAYLKAIFDDTETISPEDLRKTILTLAIQGKLIRQDPNDEPAKALLEKIRTNAEHTTHRRSLVQNSFIKIDDIEKPFEIPAGWLWLRLHALLPEFQNGVSSRGDKEGKPVVVLRLADITNRRISLASTRELTIASHDISKYSLRAGDILITRVNGSADIVGSFVQVDDDINAIYCDHFIRMRLDQECIESSYMAMLGETRLVRDQISSLFITTAGQKTVNQGHIGSLVIVLPPLSEQRKIVTKVGQLMLLVDHLEKQQNKKAKVAEAFTQAVVAAIADIKQGQDQSFASEGSMSMEKGRDNKSIPATQEGPLSISTTSFSLRRFAMQSGYRSLSDFNCYYHPEIDETAEASPICLVGMNGSGKSNLIEALAEVFCFLELINLPWKKVESSSSRYRKNRHRFELEYMIEDSKGKKIVRVRKAKMAGADFFTVNDEGAEIPVESGQEQLLLLPRRIIGYSSGLNETISHPFLRTRTLYSEEVRDAAPPEGAPLSDSGSVFDTRTLYMDYESNAAILICNYIFCEKSDLAFIDNFTRVKGVSSFGFRFTRKIAGKFGPNSTVRLTSELAAYLESFALCAGVVCDAEQLIYSFDFRLDERTKSRFRSEFKTAENLFLAMYKWWLLNALVLSDSQRKVFLKEDITTGTLERPAVVPPLDRIFNIVDVKLQLSEPEIEIDYSGLSDGEHQLVQVFGTALLFNEPGSLFLFDEPESHFNPEWRTKFNSILNGLPNARCHEYVISTHSPFVVSGSRRSNVYKFTRKGANVKCEPIGFETYGASFDFLLKKLFSVESLIDESARTELEAILKRGDKEEMEAAVDDFAESREKRRLYEALINKESEKK